MCIRDSSAVGFFHLLAAQPALAKIATRILALAPALSDALAARVELIEGLIDARAFEAPASKAELLAEWAPTLAGLDYERLLDRVRDRVGERRFASVSYTHLDVYKRQADNSSGIEAVQEILTGMNVPVIFITAFPERLLTGDRPEPAFLLTKPYQPATLRAAISQALFFAESTVPA